jgi:hypothetical protein
VLGSSSWPCGPAPGVNWCDQAWLYDSETGIYHTISPPAGSDGEAISLAPRFLGEDGTVLGNYEINPFGSHSGDDTASYFSIENGFHDLATLAEQSGISLDANGWDHLDTASSRNAAGQITGIGVRHDGKSQAFLMNPIR